MQLSHTNSCAADADLEPVPKCHYCPLASSGGTALPVSGIQSPPGLPHITERLRCVGFVLLVFKINVITTLIRVGERNPRHRGFSLFFFTSTYHALPPQEAKGNEKGRELDEDEFQTGHNYVHNPSDLRAVFRPLRPRLSRARSSAVTHRSPPE